MPSYADTIYPKIMAFLFKYWKEQMLWLIWLIQYQKNQVLLDTTVGDEPDMLNTVSACAGRYYRVILQREGWVSNCNIFFAPVKSLLRYRKMSSTESWHRTSDQILSQYFNQIVPDLMNLFEF